MIVMENMSSTEMQNFRNWNSRSKENEHNPNKPDQMADAD